MALKLNATDTHLVIMSLKFLRDHLDTGHESDQKYLPLLQIDCLIKSYRRSFAALDRLEKTK